MMFVDKLKKRQLPNLNVVRKTMPTQSFNKKIKLPGMQKPKTYKQLM